MKRTIFLVFIIAFGFSNTQAQKLKNYINKKKQVVERELDRKADQKIREGVNNIFDKKTKEKNNNSSDNSSDKPNNNLNTGTTDQLTGTYSFDMSVDYDFNSVEESGNEELTGHFTQMLTTEAYTGIKMEQGGQGVIAIVDEAKERSIIIMPQIKSAIVTSTTEQSQETVTEHNSSGGTTTSEHSTGTNTSGNTGGTGGTQKQSFKKTGKQQTILGYKCDEYLWTDGEGGKGNMWVAHDLSKYDLRRAFGKASEDKKITVPKDAPEFGVVLKYTYIDKDGTSVEVTATKVNKQSSSYDMSKYKVLMKN